LNLKAATLNSQKKIRMFNDKLTIIICTKNEERTIDSIIRQCQKYSHDIIVMDGHSTDHTRDIAAGLGAKVFLDNAKGKGEAIRQGITKADKDILVFIDADGSHNPCEIPQLIQPILDDHADHVSGSRIKGGSDEAFKDPGQWIRFVGGQLIALLISCRFGHFIGESQNGYRAIKRRIALKLDLQEDITTIEQEMIIKTLKQGYRLTEVPTHEHLRQHGRSRFYLRKVWPRYFYTCVKYLFF